MVLVAILLLAAVLRLWRITALPPGLNHDEGVNALDVERIIGGWRPIFLPANNGREALFMYTQAAVGALLGVTPATLRLTAALWGVLTVALTFGLGRRWYGSRVGLLAAGFLAVAFWHVVLSRVGLRAISAPAFYVGVLWAIAEALQRRRTRYFILAGALLGVSEYTYISARLLPFILLLVCLVILLQEHRRRQPVRPLFLQLCLAAAAAVLTVLPEASYFYRHPELLIGRTDQVLVFSSHPAIIGSPITFQQSLERTFEMFWVAGDANWLHNIAGLPVLDPLLAVVFLVGVAAVGLEWRRPVAAGAPDLSVCRRRRAAAGHRPVALRPGLWLAVWSGALLAGSSVTQESPNYLRLTALMPAVALLCALGMAALGELLSRGLTQRRLPGAQSVAPLLAVVLIVGEGVRTAQLYFVDWGRQGGVYTAFDTDIRDAAAASLRQSTVPVTDTFIQLDASAPFLFFRPPTTAARWLREYSTVVALPPPGQPALWVYSHFQQVPPLPGYLPKATLVGRGDARPGHPGYFLYKMTAPDLATYRSAFQTLPQPISYGAGLQLVATQWQGPRTLRPGDTTTVQLLWRVLQPATVNFGVSVHLVDAHGVTWLQSDQQGMMRNGWHSGDLFVSRHVLTMPADLPPLLLHVDATASLLDPLHQPAAVLRTLGSPAPIGSLQVRRGPPAAATPPATASLVRPGLYVTDTVNGPAPLKPGDAATVTLHWLRTAAIPPLQVALSLVDAEGRVVAAASGDPAYGALPVDALPAGRMVADPRLFQLPAVLAGGPLQIVLTSHGDGSSAAAHTLVLGTLQAEDRRHSYTAPASQYPLSTSFAGQIALLGYDLPATSVAVGGNLAITLNWRALQTPQQDYTVFVHLLDGAGHIVAQNDSQPAAGTLPTRGWLPNEVVTDPHQIALPRTLPAGAYRLEIGWYDAGTGRRLAMSTPPAADHLVLPQVISIR